MNAFIKKIWHISGSIYVTTALFVMAMLDLLIGYAQLKNHPELFHPLNDLGFIKWTQTYGKTHFIQTLWLYILIGLLALISLNTFICTTDRVAAMFRNRSALTDRLRFFFKLAPHIMHYALLIMLLGYLVSYLSAETRVCNILLPGKSIQIPNSSCVIRLDRLDIDYYNEDRMLYLRDRAIQVDAELTITDQDKIKTGILRFNRPIWFFPYSIHLKDFAPKSKSGMERRSFINVIIKRDPGVKYYFGGMMLFITGLCMYLFQWTGKQKQQEGR